MPPAASKIVAAPKARKVKGVEPTRAYLVGTLETAPTQNYTVGDLTFPRFTETLIFDENGTYKSRRAQTGAVAQISDAKVSRIVEGLRSKFVRAGQVFSVNNDAGKTPRETDRPLSDFLYLLPLSGLTAEQFIVGGHDIAPMSRTHPESIPEYLRDDEAAD